MYCRHIQSALPTGDGLWLLPRHVWWRSRKVAAFVRLCVFGGCERGHRRGRGLCVLGGLCVDMWRLVHNGHFCCFDCLLTFWLFLTNGTLYQSSKTLKTISVPIVTTHRSTKTVPTVYQSSKTVKNGQRQSKDSQNSKNDHWCTNRHRSTETVPAVYQQCTNRQKQSKTVKQQYQSSHVYRVRRIHKVRVRVRRPPSAKYTKPFARGGAAL